MLDVSSTILTVQQQQVHRVCRVLLLADMQRVEVALLLIYRAIRILLVLEPQNVDS